LVNLAEVHLSSGGPLDELIDAIEEVITDLETKLDKAHENWDIRTE
jgi:Flp pilus assembly protein TadB